MNSGIAHQLLCPTVLKVKFSLSKLFFKDIHFKDTGEKRNRGRPKQKNKERKVSLIKVTILPHGELFYLSLKINQHGQCHLGEKLELHTIVQTALLAFCRTKYYVLELLWYLKKTSNQVRFADFSLHCYTLGYWKGHVYLEITLVRFVVKQRGRHFLHVQQQRPKIQKSDR